MRLLKEARALMSNYHAKSGMYHYYRSEYPQAVEFLRRALKDEEELPPADLRNARHYLTLALIDWAAKLEGQGELESGVEQLRRAAEVSPGYPDIYFRLGRLLERLDRSADAVRAYREAIRHNEDYVDAHVALGFCLLRGGEPSPAAEAFRGALRVRVKQIEQPCREGLDLLQRDDPGAAAKRFRSAFLAQPQLSQFYLQKALARLADEDYEKALHELDRAVEASPDYPDLHNFRGVVLCELDRIDEAIDAFRQSAALNVAYAVPRLNLAFALVRAGRYKEAEIELESVLELDPEEPAAIAELEELRSGRLPEKRRPVSR